MKKKKTIMLRIDDELFNVFKEYVENNRTTMSHELRQFIISKILENNELRKNI
jgi:uncharacterized protein (DUF4415 family)